jgi:hypothetical protein
MCDICKEKEHDFMVEQYDACCKECFEAELRLVQIDLMESCPSRPVDDEIDPVPPMFR